jgi:hypothetical protein
VEFVVEEEMQFFLTIRFDYGIKLQIFRKVKFGVEVCHLVVEEEV